MDREIPGLNYIVTELAINRKHYKKLVAKKVAEIEKF